MCVCVFFFFFFFYGSINLLSGFWLESFCFFFRVRTSFAGGVLEMTLQAMCGLFLGLETSH